VVRKILLTCAVATFGVLVPILEISDTHLFNPLWPAHARLHEAWQLFTNSALAAISLWLAWRADRMKEAAAVGLVVVVGFLAAFGLGPAYGGSMLHTDGTEIAVAGVNIAVIVMMAATLVLVALLVMKDRAGSAAPQT
jgi:hypothetical protein